MESLLLGFPLFHCFVAAVGMWESRCLRFPRAVGAVENLPFGFPPRPQSVISTDVRSHAVFLWKPTNSFLFASCISAAATVSLLSLACWSKSWIVTPTRCVAIPGS